MKWFGKPGGAPMESDCPHVDTPVGVACMRCEEPIVEGDYGVIVEHLGATGFVDRPLHHACHLRQIIGGLNHLRGLCHCCGGDQPPDPPGMTKRQAALAAVTFHYRNRAGGQE